jgi:hypothetical protein
MAFLFASLAAQLEATALMSSFSVVIVPEDAR